MSLAILIPFSSTDPYRLANLECIQRWYEQRFPGVPQIVSDDGGCRAGWTKAYAIQRCIDQTDASVFVVADSDCLCESVVGAVRAVQSGECRWASPHSQIRKLAPEPSQEVREGATPDLGMKLDWKPYAGVAGGGICVVSREAWELAPMDPRFKVTHGEDVAWARAMRFKLGKAWRGIGPLFHLWHPPINAVGIRYRANQKLADVYRNATSKTIDSILDDARAHRDPPPVAPMAAQGLVAVLVPVMRRPRAAGPFMASLRASESPSAAVYAITDPEDYETRQAWRNAGATVLIGDRGCTFAQKVNYGYEATSEPWLLLVGDDVRFHPGWLDAAIQAAGERFNVVATNDMARDDLDKLATHPLIRRSYVKDQGASFDGPGMVAHEGYRHWYVDREWSFLAHERNTYTFAPDAMIEHLHPIFGKGESDDVYVLGQAAAQSDARVHRARLINYEKRVRRAGTDA